MSRLKYIRVNKMHVYMEMDTRQPSEDWVESPWEDEQEVGV